MIWIEPGKIVGNKVPRFAGFRKGIPFQQKPYEKYRRNTECHTECHNAGIHIPVQAFDGQWHNIVVRSKDEKPLKVLQLQKYVWKSVERTQKSAIIKSFRQINKDPKMTLNNGVFTLTNEGIRIPSLKLANTKPRKREEHSEVEQVGESVSVLEVIPESVIHEFIEQEGSVDVLKYTSIETDLAEEISSIDVSHEQWTKALPEQCPWKQFRFFFPNFGRKQRMK